MVALISNLKAPMPRSRWVVQALVALVVSPAVPAAQAAERARWEFTGIPVANYDADDKFGYGVLLQLYRYGAVSPYRYTIQPTLVASTGGKREVSVFVDTPRIGSGWRVDLYAAYEVHQSSPYYGVGNATVRDAALEEPPSEKYYRFERRRARATANVQRSLGASRLRALAGIGTTRTRVDDVPDDTETTLLRDELAGQAPPDGWSTFVRGGLVWDTRDRETHTRRGTWADVLVQRIDKTFGSDWSFTRTTATVRQYVPVHDRVTLAARVVAQSVSGDAPFHELSVVQTSFKPQEGLGGSNSLRGLPRNRFIGRGLALVNTELRWRAREFRLLGGEANLTLSSFVDAGRVWESGLRVSGLGSGVHVGYGGGVRVGRGENFVVAVDVGHSVEATLPIYIGLGFLY